MLRQNDLSFSKPPIHGAHQENLQFVELELEEQIAQVVTTTTRLVRDGAGNDDLRQAFARLSILKSRRNPIDIYRLECLKNLGTFL